jgi:hypothetical protein
VSNALVMNAYGGFAVSNASEFATRAFSFSHGWANLQGTWRVGTDLRDAATTPPNPPGSVDPQLGACRVFIPDASPMKRKGKGGADIGANVLYRYEDGVLTTTPLWDPATGEFPHGAVLAGVNDVAGQNVFNVHRRLNVNANGCQLPSWYGRSPVTYANRTPTVTANGFRDGDCDFDAHAKLAADVHADNTSTSALTYTPRVTLQQRVDDHETRIRSVRTKLKATAGAPPRPSLGRRFGLDPLHVGTQLPGLAGKDGVGRLLFRFVHGGLCRTAAPPLSSGSLRPGRAPRFSTRSRESDAGSPGHG